MEKIEKIVIVEEPTVLEWETPKLEKFNSDSSGCDNGTVLSDDCTAGWEG